MGLALALRQISTAVSQIEYLWEIQKNGIYSVISTGVEEFLLPELKEVLVPFFATVWLVSPFPSVLV